MTELEMLSWIFVALALAMPVVLLCQKRLVNALVACGISALLAVVFYASIKKTAYAVEAEMHKPLIGVSINK